MTNDGAPIKQITLQEVQTAWKMEDSDLSKWLVERFNSLDLRYKELSRDERDAAILLVLETLNKDLVVAGSHRIQDWQRGWGENLDAFLQSQNIKSLQPLYFNKYEYIRWNQEWIRPIDPAMEQSLLGFLLDYIFEKWIGDALAVYEFGCWTGHHLVRFRERFRNTALWGLDWAESSQMLISETAKVTGDQNLFGRHFDYFSPDHEFLLEADSAVYTVASLEQVGPNFKSFINYLISQEPRTVVHIEPMWEFLDASNLLDSLSIAYFSKRNYLDGLMQYLNELESQGLIEIVRSQRSYVGSFFVDGYSLVQWRPIVSNK